MLRLPAWVEAPVNGWERLVLLRHVLDEGLKKTDIEGRLGVSRGLIDHWLRTGQLDRELDTLPAHRTRVTAPAKLAPYEAIIDARLETYPELSAVRLFEEVRAAGYSGGLSQLKCYVRRVRPHPPVEPVIRFEPVPSAVRVAPAIGAPPHRGDVAADHVRALRVQPPGREQQAGEHDSGYQGSRAHPACHPRTS